MSGNADSKSVLEQQWLGGVSQDARCERLCQALCVLSKGLIGADECAENQLQ
jgi:hypothetical protein